MADASKPSALEIYRPYLLRWQLAALFWLQFWWLFTVGGALAVTVLAAKLPALESGGEYEELGTVVSLFAVGATLIANFVRPWRFHRGYQRSAYLLRAALDKARLNPKLETELSRIVDRCHALILEAGTELDTSDGIHTAPESGQSRSSRSGDAHATSAGIPPSVHDEVNSDTIVRAESPQQGLKSSQP